MIKFKGHSYRQARNPPDPNTIQVWHGGRLKGTPEIRPGRGGKTLYGPGIYATTSYGTARDYAQGGGTTYVLTLALPVGWMDDVQIDVEEMVQFVQGFPRLRHKQDLITDLYDKAGGWEFEHTPGTTVNADLLGNLSTYYPILKGKYSQALAHWYVAHGVDAELHSHSPTEDWVTIFNPDIIVSVEMVRAREIDYGVEDPNFPKVQDQLTGTTK